MVLDVTHTFNVSNSEKPGETVLVLKHSENIDNNQIPESATTNFNFQSVRPPSSTNNISATPDQIYDVICKVGSGVVPNVIKENYKNLAE